LVAVCSFYIGARTPGGPRAPNAFIGQRSIVGGFLCWRKRPGGWRSQRCPRESRADCRLHPAWIVLLDGSGTADAAAQRWGLFHRACFGLYRVGSLRPVNLGTRANQCLQAALVLLLSPLLWASARCTRAGARLTVVATASVRPWKVTGLRVVCWCGACLVMETFCFAHVSADSHRVDLLYFFGRWSLLPHRLVAPSATTARVSTLCVPSIRWSRCYLVWGHLPIEPITLRTMLAALAIITLRDYRDPIEGVPAET